MKILRPWKMIKYLSAGYVSAMGFAGIASIGWQYARHGDYILKAHADQVLGGETLAYILSLCVAALIAGWNTMEHEADGKSPPFTVTRERKIGSLTVKVTANGSTPEDAARSLLFVERVAK